ncbi:MAG: hypothetical protein PF448_10135 [Bacteroidales bacterium]|nr:hypothetical protein [Bacteroidales bacterium]
MMMKTKLFFALLISTLSLTVFAQPRDMMIKSIELSNTENSFNTVDNLITENGEDFLAFEFSQPEEEFLIQIHPGKDFKQYHFDIKTNSDYEVIDSVYLIEGDYYQSKIRFKRILDNPRLSLKIYAIREDGRTFIIEQALFPIAKMDCDFESNPAESFVGEDTEIKIFSNLPENIKTSNKWLASGNFNYRISKYSHTTQVHLIPTKTGNQNLNLFLDLKRPIRDTAGNLSYRYGPMPIGFNVKSSRLAFLNTIEKSIVYQEKLREEGIEIQLEYHSRLNMETTYRIEAQEKPGGALVAELFVKSRLSNNKVLCILRPYNYHNQAEGFLYIKEGDKPQFVTNFSIIPYTNIEAIKIMREGESWENSNIVYPGENLLIRLEGKSLQRGKFSIEDLIIESGDTLINRNDVIEFNAKVPLTVRRKNLQILNNKQATGKSLTVKEYSEVRPMDYILIDYGAGNRSLTDINGPEFHNKTIQNILIRFDQDKIDSEEMLYGVQSFDLEIRITGSKGQVFEVLNLNKNKVVPGKSSPRHAYYDKNNAITEISLNQYLRKKTYELDDWVKIQMEFKPTDASKAKREDTKTIDIIVQHDFRFDIDVSFPAGLITKKFDGSTGVGNFSGISMAMIAQFSFYQQDKINRFKPYKVGAGFVAINALNFSENAQRDMGVVIIGSLYPTTRDSKMTFPLYFGGGYMLNDGKWLVLLGPGIRVSF